MLARARCDSVPRSATGSVPRSLVALAHAGCPCCDLDQRRPRSCARGACDGTECRGSPARPLSGCPVERGGAGSDRTGSAISRDPEDPAPRGLRWKELLLLSFATSVDALAVGISFAFLEVNFWGAVALIGLTSLVLSAAAVAIGHRVGASFQRPAELAGGVVLIFIGLQVLLEHLGVW
ncbi:manganese efflux pump MntP family protein [Amnibacterium flavum]|nr:manganese efflux pump MntP family protein [Amnibacterium flavum]